MIDHYKPPPAKKMIDILTFGTVIFSSFVSIWGKDVRFNQTKRNSIFRTHKNFIVPLNE